VTSDGAPAPSHALGWRLEGTPAVLDALTTTVLPDLEGALARGTPLRRTQQRRVARLTLVGVGDVLVKVEQELRFEELVRRMFRPSRARAEWDAARALYARDVPTPEPLALAERTRGRLGARETVYVARFLPGVTPLGDALPPLERDAARMLLERAGALVKRMHSAGFDHRDLHPGNVLVGPSPGRALWIIDAARGRLAAPSPAACEAALARLSLGLTHDGLAPDEPLRALLRGWLGGDGGVDALLVRVRPHVLDLRRARERKHDAWARVASPWYARLPPPYAGVRSVELAEDRVRSCLDAHDALLARGGPDVLKDRPKSAVTRHGDLVVKETRVRGWRGLLKRLLVPGRLVAGHVNAHRLRVRDIPTARTLAQATHGGRRFTLYEDLSRLPRLDDLVRRLYGPGGTRAAQARLRDACADWLADLHARGVYHGDVKSLHVLVDERAGALRFVLIDTDRLTLFAWPVDRTRRLKNLAQLDASIPVSVTRTERLRWWRRYDGRLLAGDDERTMARRLAALLARKIRVVHAPLE
jgi:tRNA A-37 threonylcarbamoyl transferase component Bud32